MRLLKLLLFLCLPFALNAQSALFGRTICTPNDTLIGYDVPLFFADTTDFVPDTVMVLKPLYRTAYLPLVYTTYHNFTDFKPFEPELTGDTLTRWLEEANAIALREDMLRQRTMIANPAIVHYNIATMERAPKQYYGTVDPKEHTIEIKEIEPDMPGKLNNDVKKRHWLRTFNAALQFSQAYISPNWYQGGNNNLNMLVNLYYNVKLNPAYHKKLLFETTFQYKLGLNNAPDDSLRNYAISEDLFQINTTFGYKAANRWYYSLTAQFKTQLLNSYVKNTHNLSSALLSPGEFTAGVGMTYNYVNKKKTFSFDASLAPLSYNMKICIKPDDQLSHDKFGVAPDRDYKMKFGSTAECKLSWQICSNINFRSRLFVFSDYDYIQADWENTLSMDINKYLSTQIYCHARYDSTTPRVEDPGWHKLQVKEILSFGVSYKFSSI